MAQIPDYIKDMKLIQEDIKDGEIGYRIFIVLCLIISLGFVLLILK